jgi:putative tryptophan/tyrosine transport system substrate-binding protein
MMKRREFVTLVGGAVTCPLVARSQQPALLVGYLSLNSADADTVRVSALKQGLSETGYVEGKNIAIEYRFAGVKFDRLPTLASDLVRRKPSVVFAIGPHPSAR